MARLPRRVYGIETELGVVCTSRGQRRLTSDEVARHLFRTVVAWGRSSNVFLRNGSRVYLDVGSHPEYATAECDDLLDLVAHDRAGEETVLELARTSQERLTDDGVIGDIFLFKNNTDSHGNSYGCHENYLIGRAGEFVDVASPLLPFLVSRQLVCGAGKILPGGTYVVSQRADHMWDGVSSATTRSRPMINTRDEPHAAPSRWRRLHVIVGDSNMCETSTLVKVGATELVLRLIESGAALRDLTLENPAKAIRDLSRDRWGRTPVPLANGRTVTGLEMQQIFCEAARAMADREGSPGPVLERVLERWETYLAALEARDLAPLEREVDWAIKQRLLERYADRHGLGWDDPRMAQIDLAYHDLLPGRGLFRILESRGAVAREVDDERVRRAMTIPPQTTRARLRGDFIAAAQAAGVDYTVDWVSLKVNDSPAHPWDGAPRMGPGLTTPVACRDPLAATDERVDRLLDGLAAMPRR
ncbi:Pup--protein ligase [Mariniluteicoccus endophyticus]